MGGREGCWHDVKPPQRGCGKVQVALLREENARLKERLRVMEEEMKRSLNHAEPSDAQ